MGSDRHEALAAARPRRLPWPPALRAILWMDAALLVAAALVLAGMPTALDEDLSAWTWSAFAGSALTAALASLSAFELSVPGRSRAWALLPLPALVLWIGASGAGCVAIPQGPEVWGATFAEAGQCLKFLLAISAPLLALILYMLWRMEPLMPGRVMALGGLAAAGAAASLLALVHPHQPALLDFGLHAVAIAVVLVTSATAARLSPRRR